MSQGRSLLDFTNCPASVPRDPAGRVVLLQPDGTFLTAIDGDSGPWGWAQCYWAQEWTKNGPVWHPDDDGTVMTQVFFAESNGDIVVTQEFQYALNANRQLYERYALVYPPESSCLFCPAELAPGLNVRRSTGVAKWTEYDEAGVAIAGPNDVRWAYDVSLTDTGVLLEVYWQNGDLAYLKDTLMGLGCDVQLYDVLTGVVSNFCAGVK